MEGNPMPLTVVEVQGEEVTIDFNHPLAGKDLDFEVEVVKVREATPEEILHGHVHEGGHAH
jgi:FKBP-type peptidyl-prolyl cis-trans isomerase SlyD